MENEKFSGFMKVDVIDENLGVSFPMLVLYPTETPEKEESIGPYKLEVSIDANLQVMQTFKIKRFH